jgi:hypothetical protein
MPPAQPRALERGPPPSLYNFLLPCFGGLVAKGLPALKVETSQAMQLHFDLTVTRLVLKSILRNFLSLPDYGRHGEIDSPIRVSLAA